MTEIERLRTRLKNVQKNVTEYRMTVAEAQGLLKEIDELSKTKLQPVAVPVPVVVKEIADLKPNILDGGTF